MPKIKTKNKIKTVKPVSEKAQDTEMTEEEVTQAIRFMNKLGDIRRSLEDDVSRIAPETRHIFIEFATPKDKSE